MIHDLTRGRITSSLLRFALPMMAGNLLQQLYNIADTLIVGRALGNSTSPLWFLGISALLNVGLDLLFVAVLPFGIGGLFLFYGYYRAVDRAGMSVVLTVVSLGLRVLLAYLLAATALREAGIEPATTRNDINTFTMTITKQRTMANSSPGDVVKAIMTVLERHSAMSVKEIMRELQLTPLAATSGMRELMKEGRVARVKFADDPAQRYRLKG